MKVSLHIVSDLWIGTVSAKVYTTSLKTSGKVEAHPENLRNRILVREERVRF